MTDELTSLPETIAQDAADRPSSGSPTRELDQLFAPRGVVVVGASRDPAKLGGVMAASLARGQHTAALVNSRGRDGMHTSVADAAKGSDRPLDLAVLCVPAAACADVLVECAEIGVRAALVCAGGFAEAGGDGDEHQRRLVEAATSRGVRLLGPNTSGFVVPGRGLRASFVPGVSRIEPGRVAVVAASGGLNHALAFALQRQDTGVSLAVGIGAGLDVTAADVLEYLETDDDTHCVMLHIETVLDGTRLLKSVRALSAVKPVVALVVGEHDISAFAQSHTGALATSWRTTRALLHQAGAVVVDDEDQLVSAASVLAMGRLRPTRSAGAALVTAQAGPGLLIADALHGHSVRLPELDESTRSRLSELLPPLTYQANPIDTGRPGPRHSDVLTAVAADDAIDVVGVYAITEPVVDLPGVVADADLGTVTAVIGLDGPDDEVAAGRRAARHWGIPLVIGARALSSAVAALVDDASIRHARETDTRQSSGAEPIDLSVPDLPLSEAEAKDILDRLDIRTPNRATCSLPSEARKALAVLGGPVAVKLSDPSIVHKTEHGGVHLNVKTVADLDAAIEALQAAGAHEFLVEAMAPAGIDLVVGARRDPVFGPVVVLGVGGIATELYGDVAIAAVPATRQELAALPNQIAAQSLLNGFRGFPAVNRADLGRVAEVLGSLLLANPHLSEIEINPLRVLPTGLMALDAVFVRGTGDELTEPAWPAQRQAMAERVT